MSLIMKTVLVIAVLLSGLVFHLRNDHLVSLDYLLDSAELYFSIWLIIALALGAGLGVISSLPKIVRLQRENARLSRQLKVTEKEINNLRVIPLKDTH